MMTDLQVEATPQRILIASTDWDSAHALAGTLREDGFQVMFADERGLALRLSVWELPDLILLDTQLAGDDGIALCASLKRDSRTRNIPIILTATTYGAEEHLRCIDAGADDYLCRSAPQLLVARAQALLRAKRWLDELVPIDQVILAFELAVTAKDDVTGNHLRHLATYVALIGRQLGLSEQAISNLCSGARLHDVGKIGIADAILRRPGALSDEEYRLVRQHPQIGAQILEPLGLNQQIIAIVRQHHERWDGRGYPEGLRGTAIPLGARIVAVADAFDAMTAERPYSQPMSIDNAIAQLRKGAGIQWDPDVVEALIESLTQAIGVRERALGDDRGEDARRIGWLHAQIQMVPA